jgi:hypothetical protein
MAQSYGPTTGTDSIKKNVEELILIAIEDKIPKEEIIALNEVVKTEKGSNFKTHRWLEHKILLSQITGKTFMTERFVYKLLQSSSELEKEIRPAQFGPDDDGVIGHHQYLHDPIQLMLECFLILYHESWIAYQKQKQHNIPSTE